MPVAVYGMGWYPCCCSASTIINSSCQKCSGQWPSFGVVSISGWTIGTSTTFLCATCTNLDGTWACPADTTTQIGTTYTAGCRFSAIGGIYTGVCFGSTTFTATVNVETQPRGAGSTAFDARSRFIHSCCLASHQMASYERQNSTWNGTCQSLVDFGLISGVTLIAEITNTCNAPATADIQFTY